MATDLTDTASTPPQLVESVGVEVTLCEDVESAGLDPDIYVATVSAELGVGGKVNANRRIYQVAEFVLENRNLQSRIEGGEFIDAELGHPPTGMFAEGGPTFNIPARLLSVEVRPVDGYGEGGPVEAVGVFGLLNTTEGRDVHALFRAGMPIGVSSRGQGVLEDYRITEGGPFSAANPDLVGQSVGLVRDFKLERYDLVRVPSAGTYLQQGGPHEDATESLEVPQMAAENTQADARPQPVTDINDVIAALRESSTPGVADTVARLAEESEALKAQADADRKNQAITESHLKSLQEEVQALKEERDQRILRDRLDEAAHSATAEKRFGGLVVEQIQRRIDCGDIVDVETVQAESAHLFAMLEAAVEPVIKPVVVETQNEETVVESAQVHDDSNTLPEHIIANLRALRTPGA